MLPAVNTTHIAEKLRLSRNTISKALNNNPEVSEKTRKLVMETASQMGYQRIRKSLESVDSRRAGGRDICLLVHEREMMNAFWSQILKGVDDYLSARRYRIVLTILNKEEERYEQPPPLLSTGTVAGVIMVGVFTANYYQTVKEAGIPMVSIDTAPEVNSNRLISDTVLVCNYQCVYDITEHLIRKGFEQIVFAGDPGFSKSVQERWAGYTAAMRDYFKAIPENAAFFTAIRVDFEREEMEAHIKSMDWLPEALVCANDNIANKIIRAYRSRGIAITAKTVVTGFDNCDNYDGPGSDEDIAVSVGYDINAQGAVAARQLLYRIENPESPLMILRLESQVVYKDK